MNNNKLDKLASVAFKQASTWLKDADYRNDNSSWIEKSQLIALKILRTLRLKGLTQKDFAKQMAVSPQVVNKWLKGSENFTLQTICKIEDILGMSLLVDFNNVSDLVHTNVSKNNFTKLKRDSIKYDRIGSQKTPFNKQVFMVRESNNSGKLSAA
jgi:transcriptional regulator with XRE-family HTH domain